MSWDAKPGHRNVADQDPVAREACESGNDPASTVRPKGEDGSHRVADCNPLQHSEDAPRRQQVLIGKAVQEQTQSEQNQTAPENVAKQLRARLATFQT